MWFLGFIFCVIGSCMLAWNWRKDRFAGIFWRQLFHEGMDIEIWYMKDNGYGVYLKHFDVSYQILGVDLKEGTLLLHKYDDIKPPILVSFGWLFGQLNRGNTYILLKDKENNYIRKFD